MKQPNEGDKAPATSSLIQSETSLPYEGDPTHPVAEEYPIQSDNVRIRYVWALNLGEEIKLIRDTMQTTQYNYVAMDTMYPGAITQPDDVHDPDCVYKAIRDDVNSLKPIQFGLTLFNQKGELPTCGTDKYCIWQFNFQFDFDTDAMSDSLKKVLSESRAGFLMSKREGIDVRAFRELFMTTGVVSNENVRYITFRGGYVVGYLVKALSDRQLPEARMGFFEMVKLFFPNIYDVKYISRSINGLNGSLENIAKRLGVQRISTPYQAGSYSLLTAQTFLKVLHKYFSGNLAPMWDFQGELPGLVKDQGKLF